MFPCIFRRMTKSRRKCTATIPGPELDNVTIFEGNVIYRPAGAGNVPSPVLARERFESVDLLTKLLLISSAKHLSLRYIGRNDAMADTSKKSLYLCNE